MYIKASSELLAVLCNKRMSSRYLYIYMHTYESTVVAVHQVAVEFNEAVRLLERTDGDGTVQALAEVGLDGRPADRVHALQLQETLPAKNNNMVNIHLSY